eukprot:5297261-Amphidinium_carterae.1
MALCCKMFFQTYTRNTNYYLTDFNFCKLIELPLPLHITDVNYLDLIFITDYSPLDHSGYSSAGRASDSEARSCGFESHRGQ